MEENSPTVTRTADPLDIWNSHLEELPRRYNSPQESDAARDGFIMGMREAMLLVGILTEKQNEGAFEAFIEEFNRMMALRASVIARAYGRSIAPIVDVPMNIIVPGGTPPEDLRS